LKADTIPTTPVPITAEQADRMMQLRLKKHHVAIILLHWFNATTWLLELTTGAALIVSRHFRVAPFWFLDLLEGVFGTRANMLRFHIALGLVWIFVFLVYGIFGWRTYLRAEVLQREMALDADDWRWLVVRGQLILGQTKEHLPGQGSYNAGQKLFGWLVYTMVPLIMFTGVVMAFHLLGAAVVGWAVVLHFAAVGGVLAGLCVHVYMGAVFPEEKSAFFSMVTGTVDELYAYHHHFKWWREMKLKEQAWMAQHDREIAGSAHAPVPAGDAPGGADAPE
jgi:formate dehydrogenase subunit gamma